MLSQLQTQAFNANWVLKDPGVPASSSVKMPTNQFAIYAITTAAAESRYLPNPQREGEMIGVLLAVDGGNLSLTGYFYDGTTVATFADAGDFILLMGLSISSTLTWVPISNVGSVTFA